MALLFVMRIGEKNNKKEKGILILEKNNLKLTIAQ